FLDIRRHSHILLHGIGSSGKSGLGLKLTLAPTFSTDDPPVLYTAHRVLVISFLYPESFYLGLEDELIRRFPAEYPELATPIRREREVLIRVLHFLPGFLNPEDLLEKIGLALDEADLEGNPFDGILLDGLHNVFLQFPRLSKNSMIWPM